MADAQDLKSCGGLPPCGFESHPGYLLRGARGSLAIVAREPRALRAACVKRLLFRGTCSRAVGVSVPNKNCRFRPKKMGSR
jgi:hypothetical protein